MAALCLGGGTIALAAPPPQPPVNPRDDAGLEMRRQREEAERERLRQQMEEDRKKLGVSMRDFANMVNQQKTVVSLWES